MTITLSPELEARLNAEAARRGMSADELAERLISERLPQPKEAKGLTAKSLMALFAEWDAENATDDPEEIERQRKEGEESMEGLNRNRLEMEGPNSRKPWVAPITTPIPPDTSFG